MRLQKHMASCGIGSRRACEALIQQGRVTVNGQTVSQMGLRVDPERDIVQVDGRSITPEGETKTLLLHKKRGSLSTVRDPHGRNTVLHEIGPQGLRLYPVGRLDYDTEGMLLLTNDGDLAAHLTHPRHTVPKEYEAVVQGRPDPADLCRLRSGLDIGGYVTAPARVQSIRVLADGNTRLSITIREGKNRQIRRMFARIGHPVIALKRVAIGPLRLGPLKPGEWRELTESEIALLRGRGEEPL